MKKKIFTSMGLMSGTSMDGVDISLIKTDGYDYFDEITDKYYEFDGDLYNELTILREIINNSQDLNKYSKKIEDIEKKFTLFNARIINDFNNNTSLKPDIVGFHGQTIFHKVKDKISKQLGDGYLLSQLTKCIVINKFRQNDINNQGQGAPLTPIFHYLLSKKINNEFKINYPINIVNIGGITNITLIINNKIVENDIFAYDIAPGNCLIDEWLRNNSKVKFDNEGSIAKSGKINELILNQAIDNFQISNINESLDIKDFDISFAKGLNLEDGCATLTEFTAYLISEGLKNINKKNNTQSRNIIICGGGRKNKTLIKKISKFTNDKQLIIKNIDEFKIKGDFVESQAFAYLATRSFINLPISFPNTTRCIKANTGGEIIKNF